MTIASEKEQAMRRHLTNRPLDLDHLPKSIPLWIRPYLSPVTLEGDVPVAFINGMPTPLRYIRVEGDRITFTFKDLFFTKACTLDRVVATGHAQTFPPVYAMTGDDMSIIQHGIFVPKASK